MSTTPAIPLKLYQAMLKVTQSVQAVMKTARNQETGSMHATLDQVQEALEPHLHKQKLLLLPDYRLENGILDNSITVVHVESGEQYQAHLPIPILHPQPYEAVAASTYGWRVLLCRVFNMRMKDIPEDHLAPRRDGESTRAVAKHQGQPHQGQPHQGSPQQGPQLQNQQDSAPRRLDDARVNLGRNLTTVWLDATKVLGLDAGCKLLKDNFGTDKLRDIPADQAEKAIAILNLAIRNHQAAPNGTQAESAPTTPTPPADAA